MVTTHLTKLYPYRKFLISLGESSKIYTIGFFCLLMNVPVYILDFFSQELARMGFLLCLSLFVLFIVVGFIKDAITFSIKIWSSKAGKMLLGFIFTVAIQITYIVARHEINLITGLPPQYFETSLILLVILGAPFIALTIIIGVLILYLFISLFLLFKRAFQNIELIRFIRQSLEYRYIFRPKNNQTSEILVPGRMLGAYISMFLLILLFSFYSGLSTTLDRIKRELIAKTDYYSSSYCKNVKINERFLPLKGKLISVATFTNNKWMFRPRNCDLKYIKSDKNK